MFERFPNLKLIFPHGGGAIPYHMGRFRAWAVRKGGETSTTSCSACTSTPRPTTRTRSNCCSRRSGADRVLFATEKPGTGSARDPETGRDYDDLKPVIEEHQLPERRRPRNIFECNCTRLYSRFSKD